jgi:deoxyribodipyrimidine photolyase-related protein
MQATLLYPHQLLDPRFLAHDSQCVVLAEEPLLFRQYDFHAHKLVLHRASMRRYADRLQAAGMQVHYVECHQLATTQAIAPVLHSLGVRRLTVVDLCDDWLQRRLFAALDAQGIAFSVIPTNNFVTSPDAWSAWSRGKRHLHFTDFYIWQRKRLGVMVEAHDKPAGGKWSFDADNRKRLPKHLVVREPTAIKADSYVSEAIDYVKAKFPDAPGHAADFAYATSHEQAEQVLADFVEHRLAQFGDYEDAIDTTQAVLFHSVLTPYLNIGLLAPQQVLQAVLGAKGVPLNSMEGYVRQLTGWREFIRGLYIERGRTLRTGNFWNHTRPLPKSLYTGTTGIVPVDTVIQRLLKTGYCHHIERLMVLGNFMLLCEIDPQAVYRWFMELFIDSYDWVMVPNVYGMSMFADGGTMTTKPYISGSNYLRKMGNFPQGEWCKVWDALYWRFIHQHRDFFGSNPRMSVMTAQLNRMGSKLDEHVRIAEDFLANLA